MGGEGWGCWVHNIGRCFKSPAIWLLSSRSWSSRCSQRTASGSRGRCASAVSGKAICPSPSAPALLLPHLHRLRHPFLKLLDARLIARVRRHELGRPRTLAGSPDKDEAHIVGLRFMLAGEWKHHARLRTHAETPHYRPP